MKRFIRLCLLTLVLGMFALNIGQSQSTIQKSGVLPASDVEIFLKENLYVINQDYVVKGALIIEPGTKILFNDNSRIIVATGGRLIADGDARATKSTNTSIIDVNQGGYAAMHYFVGGYKPTRGTSGEPTVHEQKYNYIFNVALDTLNRKIINIDGYDNSWPITAYAQKGYNSGLYTIPFEAALMFQAARLNNDPAVDPLLKTQDWNRGGTIGSTISADITPKQITFAGQWDNKKSREWGHIIVLPGARAAFFRHCKFENFKKDTTVDRVAYYKTTADLAKSLDNVELDALNKKMLEMSNGGGGAITTFSSRTWLLDCEFKNNFARNRGGALQILQAPTNLFYPNGQITSIDTLSIPRYANNKNLKVVDPDSDSTSVMARNIAYPMIDNIDCKESEYFSSDVKRMAWDDARIAGFLGRMRNLILDGNMVRLAETEKKLVNGEEIVQDNTDVAPEFPLSWGNMAYGGAVYISGHQEDEYRQVEFGFGINDSINIDGKTVNPNGAGKIDKFVVINNQAINLQKNKSTSGAKGGAIYVGANTSLIVAGQFENNMTDAKFLVDTTGTGKYVNGAYTSYENGVNYSLGGAIYANNHSAGRLQVRGGINRDESKNHTIFKNNRAGAGGAIYVDNSEDEIMSPVIGGSDYKAFTNDFGYRIQFINNYAYVAGGAIYTKRNARITGSGGMHKDYLYNPIYAVQFDNNAAAFAGGALHVEVPSSPKNLSRPHTRIVNIIRADFNDNAVGEKADSRLLSDIRGGGAIYTLWADLNVVKAVNINRNTVKNGSGAGILSANPFSPNKRMFLTDLDEVVFSAPVDEQGKYLPLGVQPIAVDYISKNAPFVYGPTYSEVVANQEGLKEGIVASTRMLTRFNENKAIVSDSIANYQLNNFGATQVTSGYVMPATDFYGQHWFNANTGLLAGTRGYLVKVTNRNGKWNWEDIKVNDDKHSYTAIHFTSNLNGFLADNYGNILRTANGGDTWEQVYTTNNAVEVINNISFIGSSKGMAVTKNGNIIVTNDAGSTWTKYNQTQYNKNLYGAAWSSNLVGYVVGDNGIILKTIDGGLTWNEQIIPGLTTGLNRIVFKNQNDGFAIGKSGVMIYTNNGGNTWDILSNQFSLNEELTSINFFGQQIGYTATGTGEIYKTTDGGTTWTSLNVSDGRRVLSSYFVDGTTGFTSTYSAGVRYTTDGGVTWNALRPTNAASAMGNPQIHAGISTMPENGKGLGGAIYIIDEQKLDRIERTDSLKFNRVRFTDNFAFTGSVIYSDNYDLKIVLNRSLVVGNKTDKLNNIGEHQNAITGAFNKNLATEENLASSDLVAATIYGELQGPLPNSIFSTAANSIYNNDARFLIRLPDAPNTKGVMAGEGYLGSGGTDTLRGNYWGRTEANVILNVLHEIQNHNGGVIPSPKFETFFVESGDDNYLPYYHTAKANDPRTQGPFEWNTSDYQGVHNYAYTPVNLTNAPGSQDKPAENTIPEKYLFSGRIYDLYDKGTDVKTADYSKRRMVPIEDFAVSNPVILKTYVDGNDARGNVDKKTKYVKRWKRNPEFANSVLSNGNPEFPELFALQGLWKPMYSKETENDLVPRYYQPLAMPIYLETQVDLDGDYAKTNWDLKHQSETVFFVINETTTDYIRVTLKQIPNKSNSEVWDNDIFRTTVFLTPDLSRREDPLVRRNKENLYNLGSNGTFPFNSDPDAGAGGSASASLLNKLSPRVVVGGISEAAHNEDFAALTGRKYSATSNNNPRDFGFGQIPNIFVNRPSMPTEDNKYDVARDNSTSTFFAGERYGTLPANKGDVIRVVSRTVLWKEGVEKAYDGGLVFIVTDGPEAPVFTGDIVTMRTDSLNPYMKGGTGEFPPVYNKIRPELDGSVGDTLVVKKELLNKVFLKTDRNYPAAVGKYSSISDDRLRGTDNILSITAIDRNELYDPRAQYWADRYTDLTYTWSVEQNSGLNYWMMADTIKSNEPEKDGARGYIELKGQPLNPYIVPGGEPVKITAYNYAPGIQMIDAMRAAGISDKVISMYYQGFPAYFNTPLYYGDNQDNPTGEKLARFLQQDTLGFGSDRFVARAEDIHIFVMDSLPRFIDYDPTGNATPATFAVKDDVRKNTSTNVPYTWTHFQAGLNKDGKIRANLTDKLRFRIDVNTDDELQDKTAENKGWDFRYGRTAYSFANLATNAGDTVLVDTLYNKTGANIISQLKPNWMTPEYFMSYDDVTLQDEALADFQVRGQMNIRIDRDEALDLLKYDITGGSAREIYITDTAFALVANDGHGGVSVKLYDIYINHQPTIITETLPDAIEFSDYNPSLLDTVNAIIKIFDPNADQKHEFELLYDGIPSALNNGSDELYFDPFFSSEVTKIDLATMKTTPSWLKINKENGILYGTPGLVTDLQNDSVTATVLVKDEDGLFAIKQFRMRVKSSNVSPKITVAPVLDCVVSGMPFETDVTVYDRDLLRDGRANQKETLTLNVEYPAGLFIEPSTVVGPMNSDSVTVKLTSNGNFTIDPSLVIDGRLEVKVKVSDKAGAKDSLVFRIRVSDEVDFLSTITVMNSARVGKNSAKALTWGTARNATTGEGDGGQPVGYLDEQYCEIEIPHQTPEEVFDARWSIGLTNGTYRNMFPTNKDDGNRYRATFKSGGEGGNPSLFYPVKLIWDPKTVPASSGSQKATWTLIDGAANGSYFRVNMSDVSKRSISTAVSFNQKPDGTVEIVVKDNRIHGFDIVHSKDGSIDEAGFGIDVTALVGISPNPATISQDKVNISFDVEKAGNVYIEIFNELGEKIATVVDRFYNAGHYDVDFMLRDFKGTKLSSGAYTVRLTSGMNTSTKQLIVLN